MNYTVRSLTKIDIFFTIITIKKGAHPVPWITFTTLDKSDYIKECPYTN